MNNEIYRIPADFFLVSGDTNRLGDQTTDDDHEARSVGFDCRSGAETRRIIHQMIAALSVALKKSVQRN